MRNLLSGLALCAVASGATAAGILDSATGLTWSYLTLEPSSQLVPLSTYTSRTDGQRLATGAELLTFFADEGLSPLSGTFVFPNVPNGVFALQSWAQGAIPSTGRVTSAQFIFAGDQPGNVGLGSYELAYTGTADTYRYAASVGGASILYSQVPGQFGAALVTAAIPEPSTWLLMALGLGAFGLRRARRR